MVANAASLYAVGGGGCGGRDLGDGRRRMCVCEGARIGGTYISGYGA